MGRATLVRPKSDINDVTNTNLINNKANIKGTCNKDDINILARACVRGYFEQLISRQQEKLANL